MIGYAIAFLLGSVVGFLIALLHPEPGHTCRMDGCYAAAPYEHDYCAGHADYRANHSDPSIEEIGFGHIPTSADVGLTYGPERDIQPVGPTLDIEFGNGPQANITEPLSFDLGELREYLSLDELEQLAEDMEEIYEEIEWERDDE